MRAHPLILGAWALNLVWVASLVVAPYTLDPGTVRGLDGRANVVDYGDRWGQLPWFAGAVYALGDLNCHQMESRSWILHGNQMPVDARMTGGFFAATLTLPFVLGLPHLPRTRDQLAQLLPRFVRGRLSNPTRRSWFLVGFCAITMLPAVLDVSLQFMGDYESTNPRRAWTGAFLGGGLAVLVGVCVKSLLAPLSVENVSRGGGPVAPLR